MGLEIGRIDLNFAPLSFIFSSGDCLFGFIFSVVVHRVVVNGGDDGGGGGESSSCGGGRVSGASLHVIDEDYECQW